MIDVRPSHWSLRIAAALSLCQHHQQALDRCLEVEVEGPKDWPVLLKTGEIHLKLKNYTEALTCFHKVKAFRPELMEKDPDFVSDYWSSVPLHEGRIHRELGDLDAAEACFQEIIKNCPPDEGPGAREAAIVNLFKLWDDRKAYIHVVNLVKQWAGVADGPESAASWLIRLARDDDFHRCLVSVTARQFEHADIIRSYEKALSIGDTNKQAADLASLQAWHALLLFHSSSDDQRARAFDLWQDVVESSGEDSQSFWHAYHTSRTLCKHLLDDAIAHSVAPPSSVATRHAERLAKLSQLNLPVIREAHKDNDDPRLALARLQTMAGESTEARATVRDRLRSLFDSWPESSEHRELINRHCRLAQTFTVLGDDENAIAAWQLLQPERPEAEGDKDDRENGSPYVDTSDTVAGASRNGKVDWQHDDVANGEPSAHETKAGADVDDPGSAETHGNPAGTPDGASSHPENLEDLTSLLTFGCDGCGFGWKAFGDIHVCRHCMDAQFCAACHAKLRAGLLHVTICNKDHEHLYIPPFDRKQWEAMNPETMLVGGEVVSRKAWLDRLREQWGLGQSSIDELKSRMATQAQAAKVLTRWRRALLKVRAATR